MQGLRRAFRLHPTAILRRRGVRGSLSSTMRRDPRCRKPAIMRSLPLIGGDHIGMLSCGPVIWDRPSISLLILKFGSRIYWSTRFLRRLTAFTISHQRHYLTPEEWIVCLRGEAANSCAALGIPLWVRSGGTEPMPRESDNHSRADVVLKAATSEMATSRRR
jgi:hypothetical protein